MALNNKSVQYFNISENSYIRLLCVVLREGCCILLVLSPLSLCLGVKIFWFVKAVLYFLFPCVLTLMVVLFMRWLGYACACIYPLPPHLPHSFVNRECMQAVQSTLVQACHRIIEHTLTFKCGEQLRVHVHIDYTWTRRVVVICSWTLLAAQCQILSQDNACIGPVHDDDEGSDHRRSEMVGIVIHRHTQYAHERF